MIKAPRRCSRKIQALKALVPKAAGSKDWPHGLERELRGFSKQRIGFLPRLASTSEYVSPATGQGDRGTGPA